MAGTRFKVQDIASGSPTVTTKLIVSGAGRLYGIFINTVLSAHAVTVVNRRTSHIAASANHDGDDSGECCGGFAVSVRRCRVRRQSVSRHECGGDG